MIRAIGLQPPDDGQAAKRPLPQWRIGVEAVDIGLPHPAFAAVTAIRFCRTRDRCIRTPLPLLGLRTAKFHPVPQPKPGDYRRPASAAPRQWRATAAARWRGVRSGCRRRPQPSWPRFTSKISGVRAVIHRNSASSLSCWSTSTSNPASDMRLLRQGAIIMAEEHRRSQPVAHQLSSAVVPKLAKNHPPERSHCASRCRSGACWSRGIWVIE
jgi:hypothetical protein